MDHITPDFARLVVHRLTVGARALNRQCTSYEDIAAAFSRFLQQNIDRDQISTFMQAASTKAKREDRYISSRCGYGSALQIDVYTDLATSLNTLDAPPDLPPLFQLSLFDALDAKDQHWNSSTRSLVAS